MTIQETPTGTSYPFHPLANLFPLLEGEELAALVDDIQAHGVLEPVWLYEGCILDGLNRSHACAFLGRECPTRVYEGEDPLGFVISMNLRRRHLDESQRGMVAARLANMRQGERTDLAGIPARLSQPKAAALLNVSRDTVQQAQKVQREAVPEITKAIDAGEMTITAALPLIALLKDAQPLALQEAKRDAAGKKPTATQTRAVVNRTQVVATVKAQLATGKTPAEAVQHALHKHDIVLRTPALADAICRATDRQVVLHTSDGVCHDGRTREEEAARAAHTKRLGLLLKALEVLATLPDLETLMADIPADAADHITQYLDAACTTLARFATRWQAYGQAVSCPEDATHGPTSLVPAVHTAPERLGQPAHAQRREETGQAPPSAEPEASAPQTAKTGADYDTTRFYLGKPCRHGHTYSNTGQMLRRQSKGDCVQCHQAWKRARPQAKGQSSHVNRGRPSSKP